MNYRQILDKMPIIGTMFSGGTPGFDAGDVPDPGHTVLSFYLEDQVSPGIAPSTFVLCQFADVEATAHAIRAPLSRLTVCSPRRLY